ncbi:MAG: anti-sigma F factor [Peptococcaceae bacterium]|nr:anti-sigma F factor [Peptococcaceae bacterium]
MKKELKKNSVTLVMDSRGENVALARAMVAALASQLEAITVNELEEIKVAVSEAVSNSVIHGYKGLTDCQITVAADLLEDGILITITDQGVGIEDVAKAMEPSYSSDPERMGLGFAFMQSFSDRLEVDSEKGRGTTVRLFKYIRSKDQEQAAPCPS